MRRFGSLVATSSLFCILSSSSLHSESLQFSVAECESRINDASINEIVREVFQRKAATLARQGRLPESFWSRNKNLIFAVCDNRASYDTFVVYGKGVVFDYQMVAFLFAQSRALVLGRYISLTEQFAIHEELLRRFVEQGPALEAGPLEIIEKRALELGMSKSALSEALADPEFQRREQTFFLQSVYFLSMHERCHVALDHEVRLDEAHKLPAKEKAAERQKLELEADQCALNIINSDEDQFESAPVAFFGLLMTVATQAIIANQPDLATERSHPSTRDRMAAATDVMLSYISRSHPRVVQEYESTIRGTAAYFDGLLVALRP